MSTLGSQSHIVTERGFGLCRCVWILALSLCCFLLVLFEAYIVGFWKPLMNIFHTAQWQWRTDMSTKELSTMKLIHEHPVRHQAVLPTIRNTYSLSWVCPWVHYGYIYILTLHIFQSLITMGRCIDVTQGTPSGSPHSVSCLHPVSGPSFLPSVTHLSSYYIQLIRPCMASLCNTGPTAPTYSNPDELHPPHCTIAHDVMNAQRVQ